jgi:hypothetical protein
VGYREGGGISTPLYTTPHLNTSTHTRVAVIFTRINTRINTSTQVHTHARLLYLHHSTPQHKYAHTRGCYLHSTPQHKYAHTRGCYHYTSLHNQHLDTSTHTRAADISTPIVTPINTSTQVHTHAKVSAFPSVTNFASLVECHYQVSGVW